MTPTASKVPEVTLTFWIIKIAATTLGKTGGDAVSMTLNRGYLLSPLNRPVTARRAGILPLSASLGARGKIAESLTRTRLRCRYSRHGWDSCPGEGWGEPSLRCRFRQIR
jgi:hypothetical protein